MNNIDNSREGDAQVPSQTGDQIKAAMTIERRRMLLKGIGRGGAVLAAAVPLRTLAGQTVLTYDEQHRCSVSGVLSGVHSAAPGTSVVCKGYTPAYWCKTDSNGKPVHAWPTLPGGCTYKSPCHSILSSASSSLSKVSALTVLSSQYSSYAEQHWICALLNAQVVLNFPYSQTDVMTFYGQTGTKYTNALSFFKNYTENVSV